MIKDYLKLNKEIMKKGEDGFWQLGKDLEARDLFEEEVNSKLIKFETTEDRFNFLINKGYYYNVYNEYTLDQIEELEKIIYGHKFTFQSFMAVSKFYKSYALRTGDKKYYLERYQDRIIIVSLFIAEGDFDFAKELAISMIEQRVQPATPTFLNAGRAKRGELVSCFLDEVDDSLNSINHIFSQSTQLSKIGGGVSINLSNLRMLNDPIDGEDNAAKGVVPVARLLDSAFNYADQKGQREGAGAGYLHIFHGDVIRFLDSKKINADDSSRVRKLSIGLVIPDIFMELAKNNEDLYLFSPYEIEKEYGIKMSDVDFDKEYRNMVANENLKKIKSPLNARKLLTHVTKVQKESGYPYLMFESTANKNHALKNIGKVKFSNLCTEVMQLSSVSEITDYGEEDVINFAISCNLGSLNIVNVMETKKIKESVHTAIKLLSNVSDLSDIKNAPAVKHANEKFRSIGLGAMNLHGYLAKNNIQYHSVEARDFANVFFMMMNFYSLEKSMLIAKEKNSTFHKFEESEYANGNYFDKYLVNNYLPKTEKVKTLFEGIKVPSTIEWSKLKEQVMKYGLYNSYRLCIAPTQSISYVQNSTPSVLPVPDKIEERLDGKASTYYPMPFLDKRTQWSYISAYDMDQYKLIDMIAVIQEHIDQGISMPLFVREEIPSNELVRLLVYAHHRGLKSTYYVRNSDSECLSCAL
ncbi:ribonucleotide-diphosphate reductase subunit alpha [Bacillus phage vB_BpuM-BpSp]|nr:ribonucleotide-diphosphate reductase subunit alpha [Bacillus phage vB_BpuM-BpSp]